ncbi:unnamed protein product [Bubo scandiacus]
MRVSSQYPPWSNLAGLEMAVTSPVVLTAPELQQEFARRAVTPRMKPLCPGSPAAKQRRLLGRLLSWPCAASSATSSLDSL